MADIINGYCMEEASGCVSVREELTTGQIDVVAPLIYVID